MDFNLKQWKDKFEKEELETSAPTLLLSSSNSQQQHYSSPALPLFVPEPTSNLQPCVSHNSTTSATKHPRMGSSYFSLAQWQDLELQALIFRHMIAGADIPPELLHLVKKSLINSPSYYICNPLHQCYPHFQPPLLQSGYWGKGATDPEPGRCRRTDGKKWRCSRDVVEGLKYCERHMHRGRNRSRKPVEIHTSTATATYGGNDGGAEALKANNTTHGMSADGGGCKTHFSLSRSTTSMDLHLNPRHLDSIAETKCTFEGQSDDQTCSSRTLRHFFDDWPRSLHEADNVAHSVSSATNLSMSMPGNPSSDFSLKLGTGNGYESRSSGERDRPQLNWGMTNRVAPMGGPLAEALRSSSSTSSPTSVLHRLARSSASETSYVSS